MARPLRIQYPGALYHVTNRGNDRKRIFKDDADRRSFLQILFQSIDTYSITLHSFVLMKNHWHFLVETPLGNLANFMRHFNITYTSHYNRRHNRVGHLYQGRYQSFLVEMESYLSSVSRYIHLNPVRIAEIKRKEPEYQLRYLWDYQWSSLPGYVDLKKRLYFMECAAVLEEYGGDNHTGRMRYKKLISEDLVAGLAIRENIVGQSILGDESFVSWVKETFLEEERDRERPGVRKVHSYLSKDTVLSLLEKKAGMKSPLAEIGSNKQIVMTMLYKYAGLNNREIGDLLGIDYSTVSQGRKRLRERVARDKKVKKQVDKIEQGLSRIKI
jgi:putative transposase